MRRRDRWLIEKRRIWRIRRKTLIPCMQWRPYRCYCPNCSTLVVGYKNELGTCRISCPVCEVKIVRKPMGRRHDRIDIYAPEGQTNEIGNEEASFF